MDVYLKNGTGEARPLPSCIAKLSKARDAASGRKPLLPEYELMTNVIKGAKDYKGIRHAPLSYAYGKTLEDNCEVLIMQRVDGVSLSNAFTTGNLLKDSSSNLDSRETLEIGLLIAYACDSLYQCGITHRDLQPSNIILQYDGSNNLPNNAVLIDFGQSVLQQTEVSGRGNERGGQENYGSYEMFSRPGEDIYPYRNLSTVDLYSIGAIMYRLRSGEIPPSITERNRPGDPLYHKPLFLNLKERKSVLSPQDTMLERIVVALTEYHPKKRVSFGAGINDKGFDPNEFALLSIESLIDSLRDALCATNLSLKVKRRRRSLRFLFLVVTITALSIALIPSLPTTIALKLGFPEAYTTAGKAALFTDDEHRDVDKAFRLFEEGAERGSTTSAWYSGYCYWAGIGTSRDYSKSRERFTQAGSETLFLDGPFSSDNAKTETALMEPIPLVLSESGESLGISRLKSLEGDAVFSQDNNYDSISEGQKLSLVQEYDYGLQYILQHALPDGAKDYSSATDYATAQMAIWDYFGTNDTRSLPEDAQQIAEKAGLLATEAKTFSFSFQEVKATLADSTIYVSTPVVSLVDDGKEGWGRSGFITVETEDCPFSVSTSCEGLVFEDSRGNHRSEYDAGDSFRIALMPGYAKPSDVVTIYVNTTTPYNVCRMYESEGGSAKPLAVYFSTDLEISRPLAVVPAKGEDDGVWRVGLLLLTVSILGLIWISYCRVDRITG